MASVPTEKGKTMTALEYMEKQAEKHLKNLVREQMRGVPDAMLIDIGMKISYYNAAAETLRKVGDVNANPYWKNVCAIAEKQRAKGIETYGQGIEMNPADVITRIEYLQEELIDALMYCEWIKDSMRGTGEIDFDYNAEDV